MKPQAHWRAHVTMFAEVIVAFGAIIEFVGKVIQP